MLYAAPGASFEAVVQGFPTGLAGTIGVRIRDNQGADALARTTAGIAEDIAGSGIYRATLVAPASAGQYSIVWDDGSISGPSDVAVEELEVTYTAPAPSVPSGSDYITSSELKATLSLTGESYADADIALAITSASRGIDSALGQRFYLDANANQVRYYTAELETSVRIDPLVALTSVQIDPADDGDWDHTLVRDTDFVLEPVNASADGRPFTSLRLLTASAHPWPVYANRVKVTGQFGWAAAPARIKQLTTIIASRLLKRTREAPFGIVSLGPEGAAVRAASFARDPEYQFLTQGLARKRLLV